MSVLTETAGFTGTENHYKHGLSKIIYTDGIQFVAKKYGAYWLIDLIASYQYKLTNEQFQLWELTLDAENGCKVTCKADSDLPNLIAQKIPYTDFPENIKLYVNHNTLMLPSEY